VRSVGAHARCRERTTEGVHSRVTRGQASIVHGPHPVTSRERSKLVAGRPTWIRSDAPVGHAPGSNEQAHSGRCGRSKMARLSLEPGRMRSAISEAMSSRCGNKPVTT